MTLDKRVKTLSFDSLHQLIDQAQQEINRRKQFIDQLPATRLQELTLSVRARDLLYRTIADRKKIPYTRDVEKHTLSDALKLLTAEDWAQMRYKNARLFEEVQLVFQQHKAPLDRYYGEISKA